MKIFYRLILTLGLIGIISLVVLVMRAQNRSAQATPPKSSIAQPCIQQERETRSVDVLKNRPKYDALVREQIAQALHLSTEQIKSQLLTGKNITAIAAAQGFSASQLHALELNAYAIIWRQAIQAGDFPEWIFNSDLDTWRDYPQNMDNAVTLLFVHPATSEKDTCKPISQ